MKLNSIEVAKFHACMNFVYNHSSYESVNQFITKLVNAATGTQGHDTCYNLWASRSHNGYHSYLI